MNSKKFPQKGFTLIEILVAIGIIAILATIVLVAINPGRQFAQSRNTQRVSNVNAILNAVGQNMVDNKGVFTCSSGNIPTTASNMASSGGYDIANCLSPNYLSSLPFDPSSSGAHFASSSDYSTGYSLVKDSTTNRITVSAPGAELSETISVTR